MATLTYKVNFIDDDFYKNTYKTAFLEEWKVLSDEEKERFIILSSTRIKRISDRPFIDLGDLEIEQAEGVQIATSRMIDYWLEYGLDLNRISGSVSQGSFSASQTAPADPDYIPENVYEVLQDVNMYTPVGYFREDDLYRADDEAAITYGVRFETLERVKDISLEKTVAEAANKNLSIPTTQKVLEDIRDAKLSPFVIIGDITGDSTVTLFPTGDEITELFNNGGLDLDDGTILVPTLSIPAVAGERVPVKGEAIRMKLANGNQEITDFDGTKWEIDGNKNAQNTAVAANTAAIDILNGNTQERAVKASEGDVRYIRVDGSNEMKAGYTPTTNESVAVKSYVDTEVAKINVGTLPADVADLETRVNTLEPQVATNTTNIATNTTNISTNTTDVTNTKTDIVALKDNDASFDGRIVALEEAEDLVDKVWAGSIQLTGSDDLSAIVDQDSNLFDFSDGKRLVAYIKHSGDNQGKSTEITVGDTAGGSITIPTGNQSDTLKIDLMSNGMLTSAVTNGNTPVTAYEIYRLIEDKAVKTVSGASYTKSESDGKYASKAGLEALDIRVVAQKTALDALEPRVAAVETKSTTNATNIATNTSGLAAKQNSAIPASTTTDKTVSGAINELDSLAKGNEADIADLGAKKVSGGSLLSTAETLATEKFATDADAVLKAHSDSEDARILQAANSHADGILSTTMDVTFKDGTTGTYKLGK